MTAMDDGRQQLAEFARRNADYLTFYHEILVPEHAFFTGPGNRDAGAEVVIVSGPGRMGNHAVLSMIDSHPAIPRIPGEDSFLDTAFRQANYSMHGFLRALRGADCVGYCRRLSGNTHLDKWRAFAECRRQQTVPEVYSGLQDSRTDCYVLDYQETLFDIDFEAYDGYLHEQADAIRGATNFKDVLLIYLEALARLDRGRRPSRFAGCLAGSGMRRQVRWLCTFLPRTKVLVPLRAFDSYAITHCRSRHKTERLTDAILQEAWEHWFHKVVDYFFLKLHFPNNLLLIDYADIGARTEMVARQVASFLGVGFDRTLLEATIFGVPVKGNSSVGKDEGLRGRFYNSPARLEAARVPRDFYPLWESFELVKYDRAFVKGPVVDGEVGRSSNARCGSCVVS